MRLVQMIGKRLAHHSRSSERVLKDLGQLCAGDLAHQIDTELARLAGNQPRAALLLADLLLRTHCEQPNPPERITAETWSIVQQKWPLIRADFFKEPPLSTVVPVASSSQSALPPLRVESERVWVGEREIENLTAQEIRILKCLYKNQDKVCSYDLLWQEAWGHTAESVTPQAIAAAMTRLRRKLGQEKPERGYIKTITGMGFRLYPDGFES
jgi:hypothetical protein